MSLKSMFRNWLESRGQKQYTMDEIIDRLDEQLKIEDQKTIDWNIKATARLCHEANRILCESHGDFSQPKWNDAPDWQKESCEDGVRFHIDNPESTPEQSHENWMKHKLADGWRFGLIKNPEKKTHPCLRPYDELPLEQRKKDEMFSLIVSHFDIIVPRYFIQ